MEVVCVMLYVGCWQLDVVSLILKAAVVSLMLAVWQLYVVWCKFYVCCLDAGKVYVGSCVLDVGSCRL